MPLFNLSPTKGSQRYVKRVLSTRPDKLIGYWPMDETSGTVSRDYSGQANNGAYTGVTLGRAGIGDGRSSPLFDGTNDFNNIYSAALNTDFNGAAGTMAVWCKVSGASIWTDTLAHTMFRLRVDANNDVFLRKNTTNNQVQFIYTAGATAETINLTTSPTDWFHLAITWSATADEVKAYYNGAQTGSTSTVLGVWAGVLASTVCCVGAGSTTPTTGWNGTVAHAALWTTPLTAAQIASLATI
jgi:hypothetical protein